MMVRFNNGIIMVRNNAITLFIKQKKYEYANIR